MKVLNRYLNGEAKNALAVEYDIERSMIDSWLKRYEKDGYNGLIDKKKGQPPKMKKDNNTADQAVSEEKTQSADKAKMKLLEKKNKELEAEVAYLKKLNALVQERKKRESKKK